MTQPLLSNCLFEALRAYWAQQRAGGRVVLTWRPTDHQPQLHSHIGWAVYDSDRQVYVPYSFRPVEPKTVPWYLLWTRLLFRGQVVQGDDPPPPDDSHDDRDHRS